MIGEGTREKLWASSLSDLTRNSFIYEEIQTAPAN